MVAITPGGQLANSIQREITQGANISRDFQSEVSRRQLGERLNPPSAPDNGGISRALQSEIGRRQAGIPSPPSASPPVTATPTIETPLPTGRGIGFPGALGLANDIYSAYQNARQAAQNVGDLANLYSDYAKAGGNEDTFRQLRRERVRNGETLPELEKPGAPADPFKNNPKADPRVNPQANLPDWLEPQNTQNPSGRRSVYYIVTITGGSYPSTGRFRGPLKFELVTDRDDDTLLSQDLFLTHGSPEQRPRVNSRLYYKQDPTRPRQPAIGWSFVPEDGVKEGQEPQPTKAPVDYRPQPLDSPLPAAPLPLTLIPTIAPAPGKPATADPDLKPQTTPKEAPKARPVGLPTVPSAPSPNRPSPSSPTVPRETPYPPIAPQGSPYPDTPKTPQTAPPETSPRIDTCRFQDEVVYTTRRIEEKVNAIDATTKANLGVSTANNSLLGTLGTTAGKIAETVTKTSEALGKLSKRLKLPEILNALTLIVALHNAAMLSKSVLLTIGELVGQGLQIIGFKDEEGNPYDFNEILGKAVEDLLKQILGEAVYKDISETFKKANRIYQAASNIVWSVRSIVDSTRDLMEWTAQNTGRIGNALKKWRVVGENAYPWMSESATAQGRWHRMVDRFKEGIDRIDDTASSLSTVTSNIIDIQDEVGQISEQKNKFAEAINSQAPKPATNNAPVKAAVDASNAASKSPEVPKPDLKPSEPES